ncbi:hypothetical protein B0I35DRAFT_434656 [Stachybotrys elegans]|uniref:Fungal N-terminal domain-containing protein n=1 Tax=Stachybotrys elegans TaxID=80388 RepID=A0A8K0SVL2_9HYPO|nr:hypothetical protein B0I35DRAFT_434656 [Stachybotrys elegans]
MADPIGILGTAVGVASFGLQIYGAITMYLDALESRGDDLASTKAQLETLKSSLVIIEAAVPPLKTSLLADTSAVETILVSCKTELHKLEAFLQTLVGSLTPVSRLKERIRALSFPFHRPTLMKLEERLGKANSALHTAIDALQLCNSIRIDSQLGCMSTSVEDLTTSLVHMSTRAESSAATTAHQLQDLDARVQQMVVQISSTLQIIQSIQQTLGIEGVDGVGQQRIMLGRLLAKPSLMKEACDGLAPVSINSPNQMPVPNSGWNRSLQSSYSVACLCMLRKHTTTSSSAFGSFSWRAEYQTQQHDPKCIWATAINRKTSRVFEAAGMFTSIVSMGLKLSLAITTGAGAFSISPRLAYQHVINRSEDPAWETLCITNMALSASHTQGLDSGGFTIAQRLSTLQLGMSLILCLYQGRVVNPKGVDRYGYSLLHMSVLYWSLVGTPYFVGIGWDLANLFTKALLQVGVPADMPDFMGLTPAALYALQDHNALESTSMSPFHILHDIAPESAIPLGYNDTWWDRWRNITPARGALYNCGPLTMAVLMRDTDAVYRLIDSETALSEVNSFGQTPLHLAVGDPLILQKLLSVASDTVLNKRSGMFHVIDYALRSGSTSGQDSQGCSGRFCSEALGCLLARDGCLDAWLETSDVDESYIGGLVPLESVAKACECSRLRILTEIIEIRSQLKQYGRRYLSGTDLRRFNLHESTILDYYAFDVLESLKNAGVTVPSTLHTGITRRESLYHRCADEGMAQQIYDMGFRDLDLPDEFGMTPLLRGLSHSFLQGSSNYLLWLLSHGANPTQRLKQVELTQANKTTDLIRSLSRLNPSLSAAHLVAQSLRHGDISHIRNASSGASSLLRQVSRTMAQPVSDGCQCLCSGNGCTPAFLWAQVNWRTCPHDTFRPLRSSELLDIKTRSFARILAMLTLNKVEHREVYSMVLRAITFEALDLEHTCCEGNEIPEDDEPAPDPSDFELYKVNFFESLVQELLKEFYEQPTDFCEFLGLTWRSRIEAGLKTLGERRMTEEELDATRRLGVTWDYKSSDAAEDERYFDSDYDYTIYRLSKIATQHGITNWRNNPWMDETGLYSV